MTTSQPLNARASRLLLTAALLATGAGLRSTPAAPQVARAQSAPMRAEGRLGPLVPVADACSYYPLTTCGGTVLHISESTPGQLTNFVGLDVYVELTTAVCGSSIAGQPLDGPVVVRVQVAGPCGPPITPQPCPKLAGRVPDVVVQAALADPGSVLGWGDRCNPAVPFSPLNPRRTRLTLLNPGVPFHPTLNSVVFKCGCP